MPLHRSLLAFLAAAGLAAAVPAIAEGTHLHGHDAVAFGTPGNPAEATRTVEILMYDNYFEPESLVVGRGETVRFVIENKGEFLHEFTLGTPDMHARHQEEMMTMMQHGMITPTGIDQAMMKMDHGGSGMPEHTHDAPYTALVEPGKTVELVWRFAETADLEFACNVPGHYDAGMMGGISFTPKSD
jgi:uncharacterized cupredoxin-like copper-binding protein